MCGLICCKFLSGACAFADLPTWDAWIILVFWYANVQMGLLPCGMDLLLPIYRFKLGVISETGRGHREENLFWAGSRLLTLHYLHVCFLLWFQFALHFGGACWDYLLLICCVPIFFFPVARCEQVEIDGQVHIRQIHLVHITARRYGMML